MSVYEAASASYAHVLEAYNECENGDELLIPSGSPAWTQGLLCTKYITIRGSGYNNTILIGDNPSYLIQMKLAANGPARISGIQFHRAANGSDDKMGVYVYGSVTNTFCSNQVRVDRCKFHKGKRALTILGWVNGVFDNNYFENTNLSINVAGFNWYNNYSWNRDIIPGTSDSVFIEDNIFVLDDDNDIGAASMNEILYHQEGGRSVFRHNTIDTSAMGRMDKILESHGNSNWYTGTIYDARGQPLIEIYENKINIDSCGYVWYQRGGSALIWNNIITAITPPSTTICLTEEECWLSSHFSPLDTTWPCEDQINNTFIWGNTINGEPIVVRVPATDTNVIQEGRDYFLHAPQSSGGYEYYTGRKGAAGRGSDGTLAWDADHANAYYPYTPYAYPHPLRSEEAKWKMSARLRF